MPVTAVRDEGALRMWVCRLPVHIDPADCTVFTVICSEFATSRRADVGIGPYRVLREFTAAHREDRGVRPYGKASTAHVSRRGGRLCPPAGYTGFTAIFGKFATSRRADVGIGPYRIAANSYCFADFERRAFLPQSFKRNCLQVWGTVTGGAYHSARKVSMCVRNNQKSVLA